MIAREIIHTCSNVDIARAALASIGGEFAARVVATAHDQNLTAGALVAHVVRDFSERAADDEWSRVDSAARGADQPLLSGLRYILDNGLREDIGRRPLIDDLMRSSPWAIGGVASGLWGM